MTAPDVEHRFEDEDLGGVAHRIGDVAVGAGPQPAGEALSGASRAGRGTQPDERRADRAGRPGPRAPWRPIAAGAAALGVALFASGAAAQTATSPVPDALRAAPPELDESRPGSRAEPPRGRPGVGPTGDDTVEGPTGAAGRGVIRPPAGVDPGIQGTVPNPTPNTTPVIPPPGTPGGDSRVQPR